MSSLLGKAKDYVSEKIADMKKPEAEVLDVDLKDVSRSCIIYDAKVSVTNPYSTSVPICDITYCLKSNSREIASGTVPDPGSLKGKDITMLDVALKVPHNVLMSLAKDIGADWDIDYELEIILIVDLPIFGNIRIPINSKGEIKLPTMSDLWTK
uniref:LEA-2 protein n=1 Tax=Bupleurum chinense TaxID=52451 RepID=B6VAD7_BUPCH|nr:LEA-2 protein [Bupleurum chinense]